MIISSESVAGYDIIGDVHGCLHTLVDLLQTMGYYKRRGVWQHAERKAVFLGDIIDRGPAIRESMALVRDMVEGGYAYLTLGNHEYNAILYSIPSQFPLTSVAQRRYRRLAWHLQQTLKDYARHLGEWKATINWLRGQPLSLEFDNFRVVHACWDSSLIEQINRDWLGVPLSYDEFVSQSLLPDSQPYHMIERLLKGTEMRLPEGQAILGADGIKRNRFRTSFWNPSPQTYGDVLFQPDKLPDALMQTPLSGKERKQLLTYGADEKPLFIGHYWCKGKPRLIRDNIACLDYGAVLKGRLVAYRMGQENKLSDRSLIWVKNDQN